MNDFIFEYSLSLFFFIFFVVRDRSVVVGCFVFSVVYGFGVVEGCIIVGNYNIIIEKFCV